MNILLDIDEFKIENVFVLESKENIVINGIFIKILYSSDCFTMNGIFLHFPLINYDLRNFNGKNIVYFDVDKNTDIITKFSKIEYDIIDFYLKTKDINKKIIYTFENQLKNGMMKFYTSYFTKKNFYVKISGIWETTTDIGITYKLIYY